MNLVIWRDFVWLFGALLFGYLAFYPVQPLESNLCVFLKNQYKYKLYFRKIVYFCSINTFIYEI